MRRTILMVALVLLGVVGQGGAAWAGREADDLRRQIDTQRGAIRDFERLDELRAVPDEIALLRTWLDEADNLITEKEWDRVREVLDRCVAQAELMRQKIVAAKVKAQAQQRDEALRRAKDRVEKTKAAILQAQANKKALEMNVK